MSQRTLTIVAFLSLSFGKCAIPLYMTSRLLWYQYLLLLGLWLKTEDYLHAQGIYGSLPTIMHV